VDLRRQVGESRAQQLERTVAAAREQLEDVRSVNAGRRVWKCSRGCGILLRLPLAWLIWAHPPKDVRHAGRCRPWGGVEQRLRLAWALVQQGAQHQLAHGQSWC